MTMRMTMMTTLIIMLHHLYYVAFWQGNRKDREIPGSEETGRRVLGKRGWQIFWMICNDSLYPDCTGMQILVGIFNWRVNLVVPHSFYLVHIHLKCIIKFLALLSLRHNSHWHKRMFSVHQIVLSENISRLELGYIVLNLIVLIMSY